MTEKEKIEAAIQEFKPALEKLDNEFVGQTIGVARAMDEMRKNLDAIEEVLDRREHDRAAQMGYREISSTFIWLQRALGGLQDVQNHKHTLVAEIAMASGVPVYEKVAPYVDAVLDSAKVLTKEQKELNRKQSDELYAQLKAEGKTIMDYMEEKRQSGKTE
ncbi:MAG: hypothetical protein AAGE93_22300 [Bacteroidota bacterium]